MKWNVIGYYWDKKQHYIIYQNEDGQTKMESSSKNLNRFHKPKRIEDKRYKEQLRRMEREVREVKNMQKNMYEE
jgi:hypothetical protein